MASLKKCCFFCTSVEFCGHVLEGGERRPAPGKLMAVERWEAPKTVTALRGFLGFAKILLDVHRKLLRGGLLKVASNVTNFSRP